MTRYIFKKNTAKGEARYSGIAFLVLLVKDLACFRRKIRGISLKQAIESIPFLIFMNRYSKTKDIISSFISYKIGLLDIE